MFKIWLDDVRPAPQNFDVSCKTVESALKIWLSKLNEIDMNGDSAYISFDHDLGDGATGYELANIIDALAVRGVQPPTWTVHSSNPEGRKRINAAMRSAHAVFEHHTKT